MAAIVREGSKGFTEIGLESYHLMNRKIFLTGTVTRDMAVEFVSRLMALEAESQEPVWVYLDTPGGEVGAGLTIYDALRLSHVDVNIVCIGRAYSCGAIILSSAKKGHRFLYPNAEVMIHEPLMNGLGGSASNIKSTAETILKIREKLNRILAANTGKTLEEMDRETAYDHYFDATEAVEFGLADYIC